MLEDAETAIDLRHPLLKQRLSADARCVDRVEHVEEQDKRRSQTMDIQEVYIQKEDIISLAFCFTVDTETYPKAVLAGEVIEVAVHLEDVVRTLNASSVRRRILDVAEGAEEPRSVKTKQLSLYSGCQNCLSRAHDIYQQGIEVRDTWKQGR